jgi:hypothetical protein
MGLVGTAREVQFFVKLLHTRKKENDEMKRERTRKGASIGERCT